MFVDMSKFLMITFQRFSFAASRNTMGAMQKLIPKIFVIKYTRKCITLQR